jgi:hypothetical protein
MILGIRNECPKKWTKSELEVNDEEDSMDFGGDYTGILFSTIGLWRKYP